MRDLPASARISIARFVKDEVWGCREDVRDAHKGYVSPRENSEPRAERHIE